MHFLPSVPYSEATHRLPPLPSPPLEAQVSTRPTQRAFTLPRGQSRCLRSCSCSCTRPPNLTHWQLAIIRRLTCALVVTAIVLVSTPLPSRAASLLVDAALSNRTLDQMTAVLALSAKSNPSPWIPAEANPDSARVTVLNLLRIQRELQLSVPIHLLSYVGLDSRVRFGANYSAANIDQAIDPLAWGYRRISLDLYWDAGRVSWQLCPVPYPYPIDAAVNATQFINDRQDVILDVPRDLRDRVGGSPTVVCQARPGGTDWRRFVTRLYSYIVETHRDKSDLFFALIELRTWDLGIAPRNTTSSTFTPPPTTTLPPGLSISTSLSVSTLAPGTTTTIAVPITVTLSGSTSTTTTISLLEPTPPTASSASPGAPSPSPNPSDAPTASLGIPLYDTFNMTLFVPRDMVDQLTKVTPEDKPHPWLLADAQYNLKRATAIPTLADTIGSSPIRRLAFVVSDADFFTSRTPANYPSAQQDRQYLLTWNDFGLDSAGAIAPVAVPTSSDPLPLVPESALSGGMSSGGSLLGPASPPSSPPQVVDCPWLFGAERGVKVSGNETLPGPGAKWDLRTSQAGRSLSPSVLTVPGAVGGANQLNPTNALTLSGCGFSPYITPARNGASNGTVDDATLASFIPLANAWLWAPMKPQNGSDMNCALAAVPSGNTTSASSAQFSALSPITSVTVSPAPCLDIAYVACQSIHDPHAWTISSSRFSWINAAAGTLPEEFTARGNGSSSNGADAVGVPCPADYFFSVPRTPLQSWALAVALANSTAKAAWVFLSDTRSEGCWTVGGLRCRYGHSRQQQYDIITVSLFGGLLVLLLFGIFLWVKWRRYNRVSREERRAALAKRKLKQIEYTSIPA